MRFKDPQKVHGVVGHGVPIADEFVQIRLGGDMALFAGLGRLLLEADDRNPGSVVDRDFIAEHCAGFDEYEKRTRAVDLDTVTEATGIDREQLERVARMLIASERTVFCWAMGLTQHRHAVATIGEATNLLLMRGMIGKPGAGVCPVRGHSNVQGDRTMGIWEKMPEEFLAALDTALRHHQPPQARTRHRRRDPGDARRRRQGLHRHGWQLRVGHARHRGHRGRAAQLRADGADLDQAQPQPRRARADGPHPSDTGPHRPRHAGRRQAAGLGRGLDVDGAPVARQPDAAERAPAQRGRDRVRAGHAPFWASITPCRGKQFRGDYDRIRDAIADVVPGCTDYNSRVRQPDGFQLPHPPRDSREFPTTTGKANFAVNPLEWVPVPPGRLVLQTLRSHDQYNTTIYGLDDRYRGVKGGRRVVFVNPADIASLGLADGMRVDLISEFTDAAGNLEERRAKDFLVVPYSTPVGNAAAYYPETNPLVPLDHTAAQVEHAGLQGGRRPTRARSMGRVTARRPASHLTADAVTTRPETLAVEEPLEIRVNGSAITVTMRTPGSDVELAQGFLLTEGVIGQRDDIATVQYCRGAGDDGANTYNVLDVTLAPGIAMPDLDVTRNFYTTSSCGVCGKGSIDAVRTISRHSPGDDPTVVAAETLSAMPDQLRTAQRVFASTGGLHGAALFDADGTMLVVREDIGRHNAVDKVIGWAVEHERIPLTGAVLLVSGRASFELTQKAVMAGIPMLAAVSAPSSLAVDLASQAGLTLVAFLRGESMNVYTRADRVEHAG